MTVDIEFDGGSFKDPQGRVFYRDGRVFRSLSPAGLQTFEAFVGSGAYRALTEAGSVVVSELRATSSLDLADSNLGASVLEHEKIPLISYPYEWSFEMLRDAALATLSITNQALDFGFVLKDATPFNIQFVQGRPVLIDVLSFEKYREGFPWAGYSQFCTMFLYPLFMSAYIGIPFQQILRGTMGGLALRDVDRLFRWRDAFKPGVLMHVKLVARLQASFEKSEAELSGRFKDAAFSAEMIRANLERLRRVVTRLRFDQSTAVWADYEREKSYSGVDADAKFAFVASAMGRFRPAVVCDLGANVGVYSQIAADAGARVVAVDGDGGAIDVLYADQKKGIRSLNIAPMIMDLLNPSPAVGWMLHERRSWFDRIQADTFLALALVHHLAISGNIPLSEFVGFLRRVAPRGVTEFVTKDDPMVKRLLLRREDVFPDYTIESFRKELQRQFTIVREQANSTGTRYLFELNTLPCAAARDAANG